MVVARDYPGPPEYSGIEEWRYYYSPSWQLIEERVDEDAGGTFTPTQWSQLFWGLRYIDDAAARRVTSDLGEDWQRGYYHITNVQFSTETLISDARELIERVRYEAYGKARHGWPEDLDGGGSFGAADRAIGDDHVAGSTIGDNGTAPNANYNVLMDFDYSGTIEQDEYDRCQSGTGIAALDAGAISDPDFDDGPWSCAGYDGYIDDDVADLSCVRFRWYNAGLGRWMTRDPLVRSEATSYSYARASPSRYSDPTGLRPPDEDTVYRNPSGQLRTGWACIPRTTTWPTKWYSYEWLSVPDGDPNYAQPDYTNPYHIPCRTFEFYACSHRNPWLSSQLIDRGHIYTSIQALNSWRAYYYKRDYCGADWRHQNLESHGAPGEIHMRILEGDDQELNLELLQKIQSAMCDPCSVSDEDRDLYNLYLSTLAEFFSWSTDVHACNVASCEPVGGRSPGRGSDFINALSQLQLLRDGCVYMFPTQYVSSRLILDLHPGVSPEHIGECVFIHGASKGPILQIPPCPCEP